MNEIKIFYELTACEIFRNVCKKLLQKPVRMESIFVVMLRIIKAHKRAHILRAHSYPLKVYIFCGLNPEGK